MGTARFVLEDEGCEVVVAREGDGLSGARVWIVEGLADEETAEGLSQPCMRYWRVFPCDCTGKSS